MMQEEDSSGRGRTKVRTTRVQASAAGKKVGEALVVAGIITSEQLEEALLVQREDPRELGKILLSLGYVTEADMARALARRLRLEYMDLTERCVDREVVGLVDQKVLRRHGAVLLRLDGGRLVVATSTPTDFYALEDTAILSGYPVTPVVAAESEILRVHGKVLAIGNELAGLLDEAEEEPSENGQADLELASDAGAPRLAVRMRVDGVLREAMSVPPKLQGASRPA